MTDPERDATAAVLKVVGEQLPSMMAYWDTDLRCRFANRAYEAWLGAAPGTLLGKTMQAALMPQMTGIELHAAVQALGAGDEARIVFMTGGAFTANARAFLESIPNEQIEKPVDARSLRLLVGDLVARLRR